MRPTVRKAEAVLLEYIDRTISDAEKAEGRTLNAGVPVIMDTEAIRTLALAMIAYKLGVSE